MTAYQQQLRDKTDYLKKLFQGLDFPEIEVFESPEQHYRMRAEFRIWHEGGENVLHHVRARTESKRRKSDTLRPISRRLRVHQCINAQAHQSRCAKSRTQKPLVRRRIFVCTKRRDARYHDLPQKLDEAWQRAAETLARELGIHIIGRSRGQKIV